ncbi:375_t:CDS:2, partial [Gigaspora margarita]
IQPKNSCKELLTVEEKILLEEKLEDIKTLNVGDITEMTLNKSEIEVLSGDNLEEAEEKVALLYAECGCLDYRVEDTKEMISLFNKKEKFFKDRTDKTIEPNLPASSRFAKIRHCFNHFDKITATEWKDFDKTKAVFVSIHCKNKEKKENLESLWSLHYKEENLYRLTPKENFSYKKSLKNENCKSYKKNFLDLTPGRVQVKRRKVTESIINREASTSRSHSSTQKALTSLKTAQNASNQNKVLDEFFRKLQNIEERQETYILYRS